jgi:expansin (peptidoglycan-binding protein)
MKSTVFALLPFAGFALADSVCVQNTVTVTEYAYPSVTATPAGTEKQTTPDYAYASSSTTPIAVKEQATPEYAASSISISSLAVSVQATPKASTTCSRSTVTTTKVERVTVTVDADEPDTTIDVTMTSTKHLTTTVVVHLSGAASVTSSVVSKASSVVPMASSVPTSTYPVGTPYASASAPSSSELPAFSLVGSATPAAEEVKSTYAVSHSSAAASVAASSYQTTSPSSYAASSSPAPQKADQPSVSASPPASSYQASPLSTSVPEASALPETTSTSPAGSKRGDATFYGGNVSGGMCSFTGYTVPSSIYGTALSDSNWDDAAACGQCVSVTGPSGTKVTAMVVDQCPGCGSNHLDLFPDAFAKLADPSKGVISVSWDYVPCGITTPIVLKNKSGTSKYWFSMQVMNANVGVSKLEVSTDGGASWKATIRQPYNFFENSAGYGMDKVDVRVTGVNGKTVVVNGVSIASESTVTADGNL